MNYVLQIPHSNNGGEGRGLHLKEETTHLPKAETLAGTGKGSPRLRPRRPKCGGGGWRKPLGGGTRGTPNAVEAVWQPGTAPGYVDGTEQDRKARRYCLRTRRSRLRISRIPTSSTWFIGLPASGTGSSVWASVEVKHRVLLSRVSWNIGELSAYKRTFRAGERVIFRSINLKIFFFTYVFLKIIYFTNWFSGFLENHWINFVFNFAHSTCTYTGCVSFKVTDINIRKK